MYPRGQIAKIHLNFNTVASPMRVTACEQWRLLIEELNYYLNDCLLVTEFYPTGSSVIVQVKNIQKYRSGWYFTTITGNKTTTLMFTHMLVLEIYYDSQTY